MEITFLKESEREYHSVATRSDGVSIWVSGVGRWIGLPHDFAHFIVEQGLGLQYGFWGQVALGALWPQIKIVSGRQKPHAKERSEVLLRENKKCISHAEVMVRVFNEITEQQIDANWDATYKELKGCREVPKGPKITFEKALVDEICDRIRKEKGRWLNLPVGQSITVKWKVPAPKRP